MTVGASIRLLNNKNRNMNTLIILSSLALAQMLVLKIILINAERAERLKVKPQPNNQIHLLSETEPYSMRA